VIVWIESVLGNQPLQLKFRGGLSDPSHGHGCAITKFGTFVCFLTGGDTSLPLPETFQVPRLFNPTLWVDALPIGSPLLTTTACLVHLAHLAISPPSYFDRRCLPSRVSLMLQLEMLTIAFHTLSLAIMFRGNYWTSRLSYVIISNLCRFYVQRCECFPGGTS
jgi:hypothetical protein